MYKWKVEKKTLSICRIETKLEGIVVSFIGLHFIAPEKCKQNEGNDESVVIIFVSLWLERTLVIEILLSVSCHSSVRQCHWKLRYLEHLNVFSEKNN